jgi:ferric enterobactin receptor
LSKYTFWTFIFVSFFSIKLCYCQDLPIPTKKINGTYDCSLDKFLQSIGKKYTVKFKYNPEDLNGMFMRQMFLDRELASVLEMIKEEYKLNLKVDFDTTIVLSSASIGNNFVRASQEKTYFGTPEKSNITVAGMVRDKENGEALPYATVSIKGTSSGVVTNSDGFFTLPKVPTDTNTLLVSYLGYEIAKICLSPEVAKSNVFIELLPLSRETEEVMVEGEREEVMRIPHEISTINLNPRALAGLPNVGEKDIMRALQLMPGVSASNESSSSLYVRGGTPDQNLVLYDGFTVYQVDHLYGFYSAFNSNALKDVQLYKGGFGSKYGGRLSSVTEITGKDGNNKRFNAGGDLSMLSANVFAEGPIGKKFTFLIAGRKSYKGPLYNKIFSQFNNGQTSTNPSSGGSGGGGFGGRRGQSSASTKVSSYFYDVNTKVSFKPTKKDILTLSFYNGTDKLDNSTSSGSSGNSNRSFSSSISDLTKYGNIGTSTRWARKWNDKFYSNTLISYSNYYSTRDRSNQGSFTSPTGETRTFKSGILENNNLEDYSFKTDHEWDMLKNHKLGFGLSSTYYDIAYTYSQNDTSTILDRHSYGTLTTVYLQDKIKLFGGKMTLTPGIRSSYFNVTSQYYHEPRLAANFNLTEKLMLKASTGRYYQMANRITREDILSGSKDFWVLSDGNKVPVSSAIHYIAGVSYETSNYLFSMEGYYKQLSDLTEYSIRFTPSREGVNYNESFYHGSGISQGIEWLAQKKYGKLTGWVSYTLGHAQNNYPIYSDNLYPAAQDVRHEFKIVGIYKLKKKWSFSSTWIYATGRPYTAPDGGYQVTLLNGTTRDYISVGAKNAYRLPNYHRMDMSINYNLIGKVGDEENETDKEIGYISFSIFNLYNHTNVWYYDYQVIDNQVMSRAITYLGITPNITLSLKMR